MARWSKNFLKNEYGDSDDAASAFIGHLVLGLLPIFGFAFVYGDMLKQREIEAKKKEKELASVQDDVRRMLR